ncbi:MAG: pyridoxal-phosphate dependent enzyme [Bacteroidetes bacterium]|nr:pyridoxal-phosphate dependent enzyme [Bacteroidota bacterium]MDA0875645.1 pyridoxal-phosphate dependent enzyme [Bacteroidota bacterium]
MNLSTKNLSIDLIQDAAAFLEGRVRRTPVEHSPDLSERLGVDVWLKLENLQLTGSFKLRGAWYALHRLQGEGVQRVATCSAGNHGRGVAFAARQLGMQAVIFVPSSVDPVKLAGMQRDGAEVRLSAFPGYDETERWALAEAAREGIPSLSAFDDPLVMAGNGGSVAIEVAEQVPDARTFLMPVGGGGHAAGFAFWMKTMYADARIVACQHRDSAALQASMDRDVAVTEMPPIETLAGGLEGGLGVQTFDVLRSRVDAIRLVDEPALRSAMRWMVDHHQLIMEGSCAVAVAAALDPAFPKPSTPVVIFVSGRNIGRTALVDVLSEAD